VAVWVTYIDGDCDGDRDDDCGQYC